MNEEAVSGAAGVSSAICAKYLLTGASSASASNSWSAREFSPINLHLVTLGAAAEVFEGEDDVDVAIALSETVACRQHALYFRADAGFLEEFAHHCFLEGLVLLDVAPRNGPTPLAGVLPAPNKQHFVIAHHNAAHSEGEGAEVDEAARPARRALTPTVGLQRQRLAAAGAVTEVVRYCR